MTNYIIDGHDVSKLFDEKHPTLSFTEDPKIHIPSFGSIVYTVWDNKDKFIYVGIGGVGQSPNTPLKKRNPRSRIKQHCSGKRSGDQFCVYVHDNYVVPSLDLQTYKFVKGDLDRLTQEYIHKNLSYRFCHFETEDSIQIVRKIETKIKNGHLGLRPLLNGEE